MADQMFSEDELDVFGEIVNIAMGRAGATLAEAFSGFVHLRVPEIHTVGASAIDATRARLTRVYERISAMNQEFLGELSGDVTVVYGPASYSALREVLGFDDRDGDGRRQREELLLELGNALASTCIMELGRQLGLRTGLRAPRVAVFDVPSEKAVRRLLDDLPAWKGQTVQVAIVFHLEAHDVPFELLITLSPNCLPDVKRALAERP